MFKLLCPAPMINIQLIERFKRVKLFRRKILQKKISFDFPIRLNIEPTNYCNLSCSMCPRELNRPFGYMEFNLFKKIIDESILYGKRLIITLTKDGEPLLHPELPQMIKYAKDKKAAYKINFYTNGILLTETKSEEIIKSGLDTMHISIDAFTKETYKKSKIVKSWKLLREMLKGWLHLKKNYNQRRLSLLLRLYKH